MILVALGANLPGPFGPPREAVKHALHLFPDYGLQPVRVSRLWRTPPVPPSDQPWFVNAAAAVVTHLPPRDVLCRLSAIEAVFGRVRDAANAARVLDLDLLACDDQIIDTADFTLPHPRLQMRGFVLVPLSEIAPNWVHPVLNKTVKTMLEDLPRQEVSALQPIEMD